MKFVIYSLCFIALVYSANAAVMGDDEIHAECNSNPDTRLNDEDLEHAIKGESFDKAAFGRHAVCMTSKMGILKDNGEIDKDLWKEKLLKLGVSADKADQVISCAEVRDTQQDTAMGIMACTRKNNIAEQVHHHHHH